MNRKGEKRIVLLSCVSKKRTERARAEDVYISPLFRLSLAYARMLKPDAIFILSAKHGLVALDQEIDPYDVTLTNMSATERKRWASSVIQQLRAVPTVETDRFIFLAGERYIKDLKDHLSNYEDPMKGLSIGKRLAFLKQKISGG
jgi:hypothetical protein